MPIRTGRGLGHIPQDSSAVGLIYRCKIRGLALRWQAREGVKGAELFISCPPTDASLQLNQRFYGVDNFIIVRLFGYLFNQLAVTQDAVAINHEH